MKELQRHSLSGVLIDSRSNIWRRKVGSLDASWKQEILLKEAAFTCLVLHTVVWQFIYVSMQLCMYMFMYVCVLDMHNT